MRAKQSNLTLTSILGEWGRGPRLLKGEVTEGRGVQIALSVDLSAMAHAQNNNLGAMKIKYDSVISDAVAELSNLGMNQFFAVAEGVF